MERSSSSGSSASYSPSPRRSFSPPRPHPRPATRQPPQSQSSVLSPIRTLLRLAVLAALLALVVPYIKPLLFGTTPVAAHNTTVKSSYHHAEPAHTRAAGSERRREEVDVFNFKHEDYLQVAKQSAVNKASSVPAKGVAVSRPKAVASVKRSSKPARPTPRNEDDEDEEHGDGDDAPSLASSTSHTRDRRIHNNNAEGSTASTLISVLRGSYALTAGLVRFLSVPFVLCARLIWRFVGALYHGLRVGVGHVLRPVLIAGAPLTYLVSGVVFVFISTPLRIALAVGTELYPVYIFLGAAAVVGITMGLAAAAVLYISAFVFVDRLPPSSPHPATQRKDTKRPRMHESDRDDDAAYDDVFTELTYPQQYDGYFAHSYAANVHSPLTSPSTPYRTQRQAPDQKRYPAYPAAPTSLRASVA